MHTFFCGGLTLVVTFDDAALDRLKAGGFDLPRMARSPKRLSAMFDHPRFGAVLYALVETQLPPDWTPERFASAAVKAGAAPIDAVTAALREWFVATKAGR